jgi:hypothetical protein
MTASRLFSALTFLSDRAAMILFAIGAIAFLRMAAEMPKPDHTPRHAGKGVVVKIHDKNG